ncbi:MAG TPA: hypothetical protein VFI33_07560, partial [Puia sp.]|nr:hypothetical protein [Puia sp.]
WGQKSYPVPYAWKKLLAYIVIVVILYFMHNAIMSIWHNDAVNYTFATLFLALFGLFIYRVEKKEFNNLLSMRKTPV